MSEIHYICAECPGTAWTKLVTAAIPDKILNRGLQPTGTPQNSRNEVWTRVTHLRELCDLYTAVQSWGPRNALCTACVIICRHTALTRSTTTRLRSRLNSLQGDRNCACTLVSVEREDNLQIIYRLI